MNIIAKLLKFICCAALFAVAIPVAFLILEKSLSVNQPPQKSDVVVVLGCGANEDGTPTPMLRSRVERGVELWRAGFAPRILFTGSAVANRWVEADVMAKAAQVLGVPADAMILEPHARDTNENARLTNEILQMHGWRTILLVTSPFHTRRAQRKFLQQGLVVTTVEAPYPPEMLQKDRIALLIKEIF